MYIFLAKDFAVLECESRFCVSFFSDLECEEEEVSGAHSDSEVTGRDQEEVVAGRKRMHSETTSTTDSLEHSRDERGKQASNLHNEREKER